MDLLLDHAIRQADTMPTITSASAGGGRSESASRLGGPSFSLEPQSPTQSPLEVLRAREAENIERTVSLLQRMETQNRADQRDFARYVDRMSADPGLTDVLKRARECADPFDRKEMLARALSARTEPPVDPGPLRAPGATDATGRIRMAAYTPAADAGPGTAIDLQSPEARAHEVDVLRADASTSPAATLARLGEVQARRMAELMQLQLMMQDTVMQCETVAKCVEHAVSSTKQVLNTHMG